MTSRFLVGGARAQGKYIYLFDSEVYTFTPTWGGSTTNGTITHDVQLGRVVYTNGVAQIWITVRASVVTVAPTGDLQIQGLPQVAAAGPNQSVSLSNVSTITLAGTQYGAEVVTAASVIRFLDIAAGGAVAIIAGGALAAGSTVTLAGSYRY